MPECKTPADLSHAAHITAASLDHPTRRRHDNRHDNCLARGCSDWATEATQLPIVITWEQQLINTTAWSMYTRPYCSGGDTVKTPPQLTDDVRWAFTRDIQVLYRQQLYCWPELPFEHKKNVSHMSPFIFGNYVTSMQ